MQDQLRDHLQCCIELETLTRERHERLLLACGRVLLDTNHLSNLVHLSAVDLVNPAMRVTALLV